jgi:hypothetical protein
MQRFVEWRQENLPKGKQRSVWTFPFTWSCVCGLLTVSQSEVRYFIHVILQDVLRACVWTTDWLQLPVRTSLPNLALRLNADSSRSCRLKVSFGSHDSRPPYKDTYTLYFNYLVTWRKLTKENKIDSYLPVVPSFLKQRNINKPWKFVCVITAEPIMWQGERAKVKN